MTVPEARLQESGSGLAPTSQGWFVLNVADAMWQTSEGGEKRPSGADATTSDPEEAYADLAPGRRERPSSWSQLPWGRS